MKLRALALLTALAFTGCSVSTIEQTYDDKLIKDIGSGSRALGKFIRTLESSVTNLPTGYKDPRNDRTTQRIFEGQLDKLSEPDLVRLAKINRDGATRFARIMTKLDEIAIAVETAEVNVNAHGDLSNGATRFLRAWNAYLAASARRIRDMRDVLSSMLPIFEEFEELLRAVYDTARLQSTTKFDRVRRRVIRQTVNRVSRYQTDVKNLTEEGPADRRFTGLVNNNQEAQTIIKKVNERYPSGFLAEQFK